MVRERDPVEVCPEEYFRVVFEQAADGIFVSTQEGRYVHVNASGHRLLGYERGTLVGRLIEETVADSSRADVQSALRAVLAGEVQTREWTFARKDGSLLEAEVRAQRLSTGLVLAIVRDLRERCVIESQIRASEAQLRSTLETAPVSIVTVDRDGTIQFTNSAPPNMSPAQVVGTTVYDHVLPEAHPRVAAALERVFVKREWDEYEAPGTLDADGGSRWFSVRAGPVIEADNVVAAILCSSDVTLHHRQEGEIRELASRLQKIASQLPGVVYQYKLRPDGTSCLPYASDGIRDIYGLTPDDVREDATPILSMLHPDDLPAVNASVQASVETLEPWELEYRLRLPNGDVRWLYGNAIPDREPDGSTLWHGFITDITRRKETELQNAQLEDQLRQSQKVESIGRLAGGVAHDFNNLLTSVMGYIELALSSIPRQSPAAEYLDGALESAQRGAQLTQQLLAFARKRIVRPEVVSLNRVLQSMVPMIRRLVGENLELALIVAPDLGHVKVDVGSIEQVIMNLVLNARDAISGRTGKITLETMNAQLDEDYCRAHAETVPGDYVMLGVSDTGMGMTSEVQSRVFEPFFTTKPTGAGTGLGLSMCHGIVKQALGHISVDSEPGRGSTFRVYLPRVVAGEASPPAPVKRQLPARGTETVLIVEDEASILQVARTALTAFGYRVLTAIDGPRALAMLAGTTEPIHLLITDVVMPKMGGRELARRVAELHPHVRVLYSSGYTENAIVDHGVLKEGINFLQKPYSATMLAMRVREVLDEGERPLRR